MRFNLFSLILALMWRKPHVNYVPSTADTLTNMGATALRQQAWDKTLREDNTLDDVFDHLSESVDIKMGDIEIPNTIFMKFDTPPVASHSLTFSMSKPFSKNAQMGTSEDMLGNGEDVELLHLTVRYNEIKKAAAYRGWGIDFNDMSWTGVYGTLTNKFVKFNKELRGRRIRETLMLTVAEELTKTPVSLTQQFNSNIWIPNLDYSNLPVWDVTDLTVTDGSADSKGFYSSRTYGGGATRYVEAIADALVSAAGTGSTSLAYMDVEQLASLENYCKTRLKMKPIVVGKRRGYIFVIPTDVAAYLVNPAVSGSMGASWVTLANLSTEEQSIPGILGRYRSLWFVEDDRSPTLTLGGSNGSWTLQPGFVQPGNNDDRNLNAWSSTSGSTNYVFEVGYVLGEAAIAEWIANQIQYGKESTEFGKFLEKGSWFCGGLQLARFDVDTPDDANNSGGTAAGKTQIQRGSCLVLISRKPIASIRTE